MHQRFTVASTMIVFGACLAQGALAQDAASLEAAVVAYYDRLNNEDVSFVDYVLADADQFPRTGLVLSTVGGDEETATEQLELGLDFEVELHHLDATVFDDAGIATYYTTGTTTYPDGVVVSGTYRASAIAVWQGGRWQIAHFHLSELKTEPE